MQLCVGCSLCAAGVTMNASTTMHARVFGNLDLHGEGGCFNPGTGVVAVKHMVEGPAL